MREALESYRTLIDVELEVTSVELNVLKHTPGGEDRQDY